MTERPGQSRRSAIAHALGWVIVAGLFVLGGPAAAADPVTIEGSAHVVDGDGLTIGPVAIRIHGIDAPEVAQT